MATEPSNSPFARFKPRRETLLWGALLVNTEILLLIGYAALSDTAVLSPHWLRLWVYPFVWINVALWAVLRASVPSAPRRNRRLAGLLAVGYFAVLAYAGGLVSPGVETVPSNVQVTWTTLPPGWAPAVTYTGDVVSLTLIPYKVVGYLALAHLVYATILDATTSVVSGALGVLSCVSCSWPVIASVATGVAGSGSGVAAAVTTGSYGLSTVVFVLTVALLVWRPFGNDERSAT